MVTEEDRKSHPGALGLTDWWVDHYTETRMPKETLLWVLTEGEIRLNMQDIDATWSDDYDREIIYSHEIGHALGLQHNPEQVHVMYKDTSGATTITRGDIDSLIEEHRLCFER